MRSAGERLSSWTSPEEPWCSSATRHGTALGLLPSEVLAVRHDGAMPARPLTRAEMGALAEDLRRMLTAIKAGDLEATTAMT
jgi:hypothetical protein